MQDYKREFIELLIEANALKFGSFELKSGRIAPYFLNAGAFYTGDWIHRLGHAYAAALDDSGMKPDVLFGPAYKGIPLCVITASALSAHYEKNVAYAFNRKEAKDHGAAKGKLLVGAPMDENTRVVLIDDVMTAGTAVREAVELLKNNGNPKLEGVLIAFDRQEKNNDGVSAVKAMQDLLGVPVHAIANLDDVIAALGDRLNAEQLKSIEAYRAEYGA